MQVLRWLVELRVLLGLRVVLVQLLVLLVEGGLLFWGLVGVLAGGLQVVFAELLLRVAVRAQSV